MNVFATSPSPYLSAQALDDKRVRKMLLETTQLLSFLVNRGELKATGEVYRSSHENHPISLWLLREGFAQVWVYEHALALCTEYRRRFGVPMACEKVVQRIVPKPSPAICRPSFVNCARNKKHGLDFTHLPVHEAYRAYLSARWEADKLRPIWTNHNPPMWRT